MRSFLCASVQCAGRKVPFSRQAVTFFHLHGMVHSLGGPNGGYSWDFPTRVTPPAPSKNSAGRLLVNGEGGDPIANRVLDLLMQEYTVAGEKSGLVLTKNTGDLKLFINELDDLRQVDFIHNRAMVRHIERLRTQLTASNEHRERWKVRALMAEALALEATAKISNNGGRGNVVDTRYAALKRFLAKRFHPDYAPGGGIEKIVRNEIFKEIWNEIERLEDDVSASRFATAASRSAA